MNLEQKKEYNKEYHIQNKDKRNEYSKKYDLKNKDIRKDRDRKRNLKKYNLTEDQYNKMLSDQNYSCKICDTHEIKLTRKLAVDHCHATGKIRGLLCNACNTSLGKLKEDTKIMQKLIEYVKEHNE